MPTVQTTSAAPPIPEPAQMPQCVRDADDRFRESFARYEAAVRGSDEWAIARGLLLSRMDLFFAWAADMLCQQHDAQRKLDELLAKGNKQ